jgi:hypothetical protein
VSYALYLLKWVNQLIQLEKDLIEAASRIDAVQKACSVAGSVVDELKFGLMGVVYQWASGMVTITTFQYA